MGRASPRAHSRLSHQEKPDSSRPASTPAKTSAATIRPQRRISTHVLPVWTGIFVSVFMVSPYLVFKLYRIISRTKNSRSGMTGAAY